MNKDSGNEFDVVVVGGGPGGYVAAIRVAQLGGRVAVIEKDKVGGTCVNVGCIPTKSMLRVVEFIDETKKADEFGVSISGVSLNPEKMFQFRDKVVTRLVEGIKFLLQNSGVELINGVGFLGSGGRVDIQYSDGRKESLVPKKIILATGSIVFKPSMPGIDGKDVITGEEAAVIKEIPKRIIVIGGGAEGVEFASVFSKLGSEVTIVEMLPHLLPLEDRDLGMRLQRILAKGGIKVLVGSKVLSIEDEDELKKVKISSNGGEQYLFGEKVLAVIGRRPNIRNLGLEEAGIVVEDGRVKVNEKMETNIPQVYAIGDMVGGAFAHEAMMAGEVAAENAMGLSSTLDKRAIPRCIYTIPEVAAVGLTEEQAKKNIGEVRVGRFPLTASGRAQTLGETEGYVKVIIDVGFKKILGFHMLGPRASDMIEEVIVAMKSESSVESIIQSIHPHPTLSEIIREVVLDAENRAIHKARITRQHQL